MSRIWLYSIIFTILLSSTALAVPVVFDPIPKSGSYMKGGINQFSINVTEAGLNTTNVSLFIKAQAETLPEAWDQHSLTCQNYASSNWFCAKNISLLIAGDDTAEVYFFTASDNFGNQGNNGTASNPLNVTVDVNPPKLQSSNLKNATYVSANQKVEMDVFDQASKVNQSLVFFRHGNSSFNSSWEQMSYDTLFKYSWATSSLVLNGSYSVYFNATDNVGNTNVSKLFDVLVDNEFPSITITQPTAGKTLFDNISFTINVKDSYSGIDNTSASYRIGNSTGPLSCSGVKNENNCSTTFDTTKITDGSYSLVFSVLDVSGNQNNASIQVLVNNTKVSITLTYPPNGAYVREVVNITASLNNIASGIDKVQLRWENTSSVGGWNNMTCSSDYKCHYMWNTTEFAETTYTFRFNVTGTLEYLVEKTTVVSVDNTKPLITIQKPTETKVNGTITPLAVIIDGSGVNASTVKFNISTFSEPMTCSSFESGKRLSCGGSFDTTKLSDGTYTLYFLASDLAGNQNIESIQFAVYNAGAPPSEQGTTTTLPTETTVTTISPSGTQQGIFEKAISPITNFVKSNPIIVLSSVISLVAILYFVYTKLKKPAWKTSYQ